MIFFILFLKANEQVIRFTKISEVIIPNIFNKLKGSRCAPTFEGGVEKELACTCKLCQNLVIESDSTSPKLSLRHFDIKIYYPMYNHFI